MLKPIIILTGIALIAFSLYSFFGFHLFSVTASALNYQSAVGYSDILDASMSGECSSTGNGYLGILIQGTPSGLSLNRDRSYIQMSGGDSGRYGGNRINWGYSSNYPNEFWVALWKESRSNPYQKVSIVTVGSDFQIPQGNIGCSYHFHLEFDNPQTVTTTTTTVPGLVSPTTTTMLFTSMKSSTSLLVNIIALIS